MGDQGDYSEGRGTTLAEAIEKELAKERKEMKSATDKQKKADHSYRIAGLKMAHWPKATLEKTKTNNKMKLDGLKKKLPDARKNINELDRIFGKNQRMYTDGEFTLIRKKWELEYTKETGKKPTYKTYTVDPYGEYKDWLQNKLKEQKKIVQSYHQCVRDAKKLDYALKYQEQFAKTTRMHDNPGRGNGGGARIGGDNEAPEQDGDKIETKQYKDENGEVQAIATYKNGKLQDCQFKDKDGKFQSLKAEEIQQADINADVIKAALESGDLSKALELLLQALGFKQQQEQLRIEQEQQNQPLTQKDYTDEQGQATYTVQKRGDKIECVAIKEEDSPQQLVLSAEYFANAGVDPKVVVDALERKDFRTAHDKMYEVAEKNGIEIKKYLEPKVEVRGDDIVLTDREGQTFTLNKQTLKAMGVETKASGTMKKLREAISANPRAMMPVVASYFAGRNPAPNMPTPPEGNWSASRLEKSSVDMIRSSVFGASTKSVYITVTDGQGHQKELRAQDFANYFGCSKEDGKKILRSYARAIEDGHASSVNGVLSAVAEAAPERESTRTSRTTLAYLLGAAGIATVAAGGYMAYKAIKKKGDNGEEAAPETRSQETEAQVEVRPVTSAPSPLVATAKEEVTPTNTPEVTPTKTPDVTPTNTPDVTPTNTPDVTPSPAPSPVLNPIYGRGGRGRGRSI